MPSVPAKLSAPARTALAHVTKGDKYHAAATTLRKRIDEEAGKVHQLEKRGDDHYRSAGLLLVEIRKTHNTKEEGAWASVVKRKCGLEARRVQDLIAFATGRRDLTVHRTNDASRKREERKGKSSGGTSARPAGNNSQSTQDRKADERASRTASFMNIMEDSEQAASESLVRFADLQDFGKLAIAARRLSKAWERAATKLERLSDADI